MKIGDKVIIKEAYYSTCGGEEYGHERSKFIGLRGRIIETSIVCLKLYDWVVEFEFPYQNRDGICYERRWWFKENHLRLEQKQLTFVFRE